MLHPPRQNLAGHGRCHPTVDIHEFIKFVSWLRQRLRQQLEVRCMLAAVLKFDLAVIVSLSNEVMSNINMLCLVMVSRIVCQ